MRRQILDRQFRRQQRLQPLVFVLRLGAGVADHGHHAGQHLDRIGVPAVSRGAALDVGVKRPAGLEILLHRERDLRGLGGKIAAVVGLAGLHDHRMALRRAMHGERPAHRKMLALVIEEMQFRRVEIDAAVLVGDHGAVFKTVPQPEHDLGEFAGAGVAIAVMRMALAAEIVSLGDGERRHQIPPGAAAADLVERRKEPRHMERLEIGRGRRRHEADALGDGGQRAKERDRFEPRRLGGARPRLDVVGAEGGVGVGHEQQIELAAFGQPRDVDVVFERLPAVRIDVGIAPGGDMVAGAFDEQAKLHHGRTRRAAQHRSPG